MQLELSSPQHTDEFGALLARCALHYRNRIIDSGLNIRLEGNLGAGKTSLARAMLRALGVEGRIKSPTFTLLETYPIDQLLEVYHFDFYRFESPEEFLDAGFRDHFAAAHITLVEWSEKAGDCLPKADLTLILEPSGNGRCLTLVPGNSFGRELADSVVTAWQSREELS